MPIAKTCQHCEAAFVVPPSRSAARFCGTACNYAYRKEHQEWTRSAQRVECQCANCDKPFYVLPSQSHRVVCSWECETERRKQRSPEDWPRYIERETLSCRWCDKSFETHRSWAKKEGRGRFCSRSCRAAWVCRHAQSRVSKAEESFAEDLRRRGMAFDVQVQVRSFVVDVIFEEEKVVVEFDGDYWHSLPRTAAKDRRKDAALLEEGYQVVRVKQSAYEQNPEEQVQRIADALNGNAP
jgi:very-short-patch-repair endonuclease